MLKLLFVITLYAVNSVRQAFDRHASVYDQVFSDTQIRAEVWHIADRLFSRGMHILDLGCGTGQDAIHFAQRGINVTAVDISAEMIAQLRRKAGTQIQCEEADMRSYTPKTIRFDGVFSNFGALNCVPNLEWLRQIRLTPGSHVVLTTMGRFYPFESAVFLLKGEPRLAFRRLARSCEAVVEGVRFNVYYHRRRSIQRALGPGFELRDVRGLRSLLPAPGFEHLEKFEALRFLEPVDRWLCSQRLTASCADHFVSVWRYRET
ncbi:MAG TPA: class I SAM-dependent methyltransferase [Terriglobia bacterium]|nr:class I SAM-dependent methyltransferase [Terriglobia bacterium]